ncbi:hypothetical protein [Polycladidibacter stylochi]|uniref:hypothetical protein n=1 Tax=Polycladidibacter stylochi TaxID=1807766 RepID=UPI00082F933B|nr:hypothetical protein [Pseudovibrio stylochi]
MHKKHGIITLVSLLVLSLTGCGGITSSDGEFTQHTSSPAETEKQITPEDVAQIFAPPVQCPKLEALTGTQLLEKYPRRKQGDQTALLYQANISDSAATCKASQGQVVVKLGLAGRITPGPGWKGGSLQLPVRVAVVKSSNEKSKPVYSNLFKVNATIEAGSPSQAWVLVEENITIPTEGGMKLIFGFDDN